MKTMTAVNLVLVLNLLCNMFLAWLLFGFWGMAIVGTFFVVIGELMIHILQMETGK